MAVVNERRPCTVCIARAVRVDATHVAATASGGEWYECGEHEPTDNLSGERRVQLTPIAEWFAGHGLPVPGVVIRPEPPKPPTEWELREMARRYPELHAVLIDDAKGPPPKGVVTLAEMRALLARPETP